MLGALGLAACDPDPYPGETPATLHTYAVSEMKGFDPVQADEETSNLMVGNVYDALYEYHYLKRRPLTLVPSLAASLPEVSEDGLTHRIALKPGVRFVDDPCFTATGGRGREVTAHDVVFCFLRLMDSRAESKGGWVFEGKIEGLDAFHEASAKAKRDPRRARYTAAEGYPEVPGLRAVDDHTLEIRLVEPYPQLHWVLAMGYASVYAPEAVAHYGEEFLNHAVGTGPYRVVSYRPAQRLVLERNPTYRDDRYPSDLDEGDDAKRWLADAGKALPLNDRVVVTVFKETQPMWLYFRRGFLDRVVIPKDNFASAVDAATKELRPAFSARGVVLDKDPRLEVIYDGFNVDHPVTGKGERGRAIRRAISLAIDQEWATEHLYNHRVTRSDGVIVREFPEFDPTFVNPWKKRPDETRAQVLARATKVLADAGFADPARDVPVIEQDVQESTTDQQHFLAAQRDVAEIGLRLRANTVTWQEMNARINKGQAQMWGMSWGADYPEAQNFLQLFYGPNAPIPNGSGYKNPEFDALFKKAATMGPSPERTEIYRRMERMVVEDCPWVIKYRRLNYTLCQPWLPSYRYNDISTRYFKYCRVDGERRRAETPELNRRKALPPLLFSAGLLSLLLGMVAVARRTKRGW